MPKLQMFQDVYHNRILPEYYRVKYKSLLRSIPVYAMFIGYPRSGHSLVGAILDAHPNIVMGHEVNVLRLFERGFKPDFILARIISKSEHFVKNEGSRTGYKYLVPNQYQGRFTEIKVIGDKKGGATSLLLKKDFDLINRVDDFRKLVKMIHVIRNPFDNIASRARGGNLVRREVTEDILEQAIDQHFNDVKIIRQIKDLKKYDIYDLHGSDLLLNPKEYIREMCNFLGVEAETGYVKDCESIMFKEPKGTRHEIKWTDAQIRRVKDECQKFDFLRRYDFD